MKFHKVSALVKGCDWVTTYHFTFGLALNQLKSHDYMGNATDISLEECACYGDDPYIPDHDYDIHYVPMYVVKAGNEFDRVHYCFRLDHLKSVLTMLQEDGFHEQNMSVETVVVAHQRDIKVNPSETMTLGQLLKSKLDKPPLKGAKDIIDALVNGNKVAAIKNCRDVYGLGLKEAKDVIDYFCGNDYVKWSDLSATQASAVGDIRTFYGSNVFKD